LFIDDGASLLPTTEVNMVNDPSIRYIPTLRSAIAIIPITEIGKTFTFSLHVFNREGSISSVNVCFLFATIPPQPIAGPSLVSRSGTSITVAYSSLLNGGTPITSYHL
jgi:hypothetical protein